MRLDFIRKEFLENFKKNRIDLQYSDFSVICENLLMNIENEDFENIEDDLRELVILWKILKKNLKKDKRW